jgi:prepilin-type N-terminal cleavage/methylation domain-containing protein
MEHRERGFTILELLIVAGIIGIIAAIAIWNYAEAVQRSKQKRTMADIRSLAQAWEARAIDAKAYNAAGFTIPAATLSASDMDFMLVPTYTRMLPKVDGWGHAFELRADYAVGAARGSSTYAIRSTGRDGVYSGTTYNPGPTTNFDCDLVFSNGSFVVWPEGLQSSR